jgi:meso-butanediol dehydrogenase / (S,S)-butanediol dehydrogenase / diacetyl reductase
MPARSPGDTQPREVVLITGAAGAIGSATVHAFMAAGFSVVGLDVVDAVTAVPPAAVPESTAPAGSYRGIQVDVEDEVAVAEAVAVAGAEAAGPLAHVVGIAGGALPDEPATQTDPVQLSPKVFRASVEANLTSQFVVMQAALPWLRARAGVDRSITFTSSWNALTGVGMPAYSAAKAGVIGMMHALTVPLGQDGIRVNVVAPGTIRTPRTEKIWAHDEGRWERLAATTAVGRLGDADDVARTFVALATALTHVTGQVLVVDGGQLVKR